MAEYIKREDAVSKFTPIDEMHIVVLNGDSAISVINSIPSADVAPVRHGKWIHERIESEESSIGFFLSATCECSLCRTFVQQESKYCPNCGAKMRGE